MCRLLGLLGPFKNWHEILFNFQNQSQTGKVPPGAPLGHHDGWGMAASLNRSPMILIDKRSESAYKSQNYLNAVSRISGKPLALLAHLRKASPGINVNLKNVHPFFSFPWAFIHNGTFYNAENLPRNKNLELTSDGSDSEFFFHFLLTFLLNQSTIEENWSNFVQMVLKSDYRFTAINSIFTNGTDLYAIRWWTKNPEYYTLYLNFNSLEGAIVSSEPISLPQLDKNHWREIPNQSLIRVTSTPLNFTIVCG